MSRSYLGLCDFAAEAVDSNNNPESKLVALEMHEMKDAIVVDGSDKRWWDCESALLKLHGSREAHTPQTALSRRTATDGDSLKWS